jgi:hypothetical protein
VVINRRVARAKIGQGDGGIPGYLILSQSDGLDQVKLVTYLLPIEPDAKPLVREPRIRGWSWFRPYHDLEKLALATDLGVLGVYGIKQVRNDDPPLFPVLPEEIQVGEAAEGSLRPGRAQVVHAAEEDFWILARGRMQRLQLNPYKDRVEHMWDVPPQLGSPLHAAHLDEAGKTLFVVTQSLSSRGCLASAVRAADGKILWQRHIGLDCQSDPIVLGEHIVALDRDGALFVFDSPTPETAFKEWQAGGRLVAPPLQEMRTPPSLLMAPDGKSVYEIATSSSQNRLVVRHYVPGKQEATATESDLDRGLAGNAVLGPDFLLLPLADGELYRRALEGGQPISVRTWRDNRADENAVCHVAHFNNTETLFTNGLRTLTWIRWRGNEFDRVAEATVGARIIAPPIVLPAAQPEDIQVVVPDASDTLMILDGPKLKPSGTVKLSGKITGVPFLSDKNRVGCVVNRNRLVWVDLAERKELWHYEVPGESIVGRPQLIEGMLVLADAAGHLVGLDLEGKPVGQGYVLKASAAPAAAPVAFGPGRALVPLTDGTLFVLRLGQLRDEKEKE